MKNWPFVFFLFGIIACDKPEADLSAPTIDWLSLSPNPISDTICGVWEVDRVLKLYGGDSLKLGLRFNDDTELSQYKIDIHGNFDCHGHRGPNTTNWNFIDIQNISGLEHILNSSIAVPVDVTAGTYHFQVQVVDASGNESDLSDFYTLKVLNLADTIPPSLVLSQPNQSNITLSKGSILNLQGTVSDNEDLEGGRLELSYISTSGEETDAWSLDFPAGMSYNFDQNYTIPTNLSNGDYDFELKVYDAVGNLSLLDAFIATIQ